MYAVHKPLGKWFRTTVLLPRNLNKGKLEQRTLKSITPRNQQESSTSRGESQSSREVEESSNWHLVIAERGGLKKERNQTVERANHSRMTLQVTSELHRDSKSTLVNAADRVLIVHKVDQRAI